LIVSESLLVEILLGNDWLLVVGLVVTLLLVGLLIVRSSDDSIDLALALNLAVVDLLGQMGWSVARLVPSDLDPPTLLVDNKLRNIV
jgi:hypothetical protein